MSRGLKVTLAISGALLGTLLLMGVGYAGLIGMAFHSEVNRGVASPEERAAFDERIDIYTAYDAQGREIMLSYIDDKPYSISVHTSPNSSEQRLVEHGAAFIAYTETGEPWVRPDSDLTDDAPTDDRPTERAE